MPRHCSKPATLAPRSTSHAARALLAIALLLACFPTAAVAAESDPTPDGPYGTGPQITEDGRLFAWLHLPGLPSHPELETLHVERSWADDPDTWEPVYTFVWDEDWAEFAAVEDPFQTIRYYNYDTGEDIPYVDYFEAESSGRSFFLRARADVVVDGEDVERPFEPVLFIVADGEDEKAEPPVDAGDGGGSGGDKGGIGQGEHERPAIEAPAPPSEDDGSGGNQGSIGQGEHEDPVVEVPALPSEDDGSSDDNESIGQSEHEDPVVEVPALPSEAGGEEYPSPSPAGAPPFGPQEEAAEPSDATVDSNTAIEDDASEHTPDQHAPTASDQQASDVQDPTPPHADPVTAPSRLPGALAALVATAALAGAATLILRLRRR